MKKILFVCIENSCRSQMAEAFAKIYGKGKVHAFSAGSKPSGKINAKAVESMQQIGYDLTTHHSKSVEEFRNQLFDYIITMGCVDTCPVIPAKFHDDWQIPDPSGMTISDFNRVRDIIEEKVKDLLGKVIKI